MLEGSCQPVRTLLLLNGNGSYSRKTVTVATIVVEVVDSVTVCVTSKMLVAVTCEVTVGVTVLRDVLVVNAS